MTARFVVGIDLGTTNSAVAYAEADGGIHGFAIPQVIGPGEVEERATLPSFLLLPGPHDVAAGALALPWARDPGFAVGTLARERGAELPHRLVASAKSWLCHPGVDRKAPILPWRVDTPELPADAAEGERVSPVTASARYLAHIRAAWDAGPGREAPLAEQEVYLTVPASFDAAARELTVQAAAEAGLPHVTLLEEPQAAFYSWIATAGEAWRDALAPGDVVLVCDIGGGTTDFSLIAVTDDGTGNLALERVAVGDHILLGGDNMDLALAHALATRLAGEGKKVTPLQQRTLIHACRRAKEELLGEAPPAKVPIAVLGRSSKLIGGTLRSELAAADVAQVVVDGFFPQVAADARPQQRRRVGLTELGLPYAADAAVTRHLAEFLGRHGRRPSAILWNGGVMKAAALRDRLGAVLGGWLGGAALRPLEGTSLDLAVAHGAAYYGLVRRGRGIRIRGGTARSYYIGVESAMPAIPGFAPPVKGVCVAPFGMEEGSSAAVPGEELGLVVGEAAEFRFFASSSRRADPAGAVVDTDSEEVAELTPVETVLPADAETPAGKVVPVTLESRLTEVGTLELWCVARDRARRWKLEYSVREQK